MHASSINQHLDHCLAKKATSRTKAQPTSEHIAVDVFGYLPALIVEHIAPLLAAAQIEARVTVLEAPASARAVASAELQVRIPPAVQQADERQRVQAILQKAAAAAEGHEATTLQRQSSGTGEILRTNFLLIADLVREQDGHLLTAEELLLLDAFKALGPVAQSLYLRLFQRRGPWFRVQTLNYSEALLGGLGLLPRNGRNGRAQLVALAKDALTTPPVPGSEQQAQQVLQELLHLTGPCVRLGRPLAACIRRIQRLFFLNEGQDLSHFLVTDLGIMRYPSFRVHRTRPVFADRAALLEYEAALEDAAALDTALEEGDVEAAEAALVPALAAIAADKHKEAPTSFTLTASDPFSAAWVFTAMATAGVSLLEKRKQYQEATELLRKLLGGACCPGRRGEWWVRLSVDTEHLGRVEEALEVAQSALADEWVKHGDRIALQRRILRLGKPPRRWKKPPWAGLVEWEPPVVQIEAQPLPNALGLKSKFPAPDGGECGVEELALLYYASEEGGGWQGTHSENGIWHTLFGLLLWDTLFLDVPDVFRTPFQTAPLDLSSLSFYPARKPAIQACLAQIRGGGAPEMLRKCWEAHHGVMCRGINWERHGLEDLVTIAECVGGRGLAAICQLLAEDLAGWSGGMPDLLLWKPGVSMSSEEATVPGDPLMHAYEGSPVSDNLEGHRPDPSGGDGSGGITAAGQRRAGGCAKLSEVKGPRDRLSEQQRAWIGALTDAGVAVEVLKVVEPTMGPAKRARRRKW
ncbi:hypothetical protein WJX72_003785 [[Myrmecia] bisecta]|uniref:Fanconi-associated nuclease n=1 Tax=[Myrmecia] bisecta TaxID=41462 RepID=A0AAW1R5K1_9CHLO